MWRHHSRSSRVPGVAHPCRRSRPGGVANGAAVRGEGTDRSDDRRRIKAARLHLANTERAGAVRPENGGDLDPREFTRAILTQVEGRLIRGAVNHHDTDIPHARDVVRGGDVEGCEVRIDPEYTSRGMRSRAQEIATAYLGPRSIGDLEREQDQALGRRGSPVSTASSAVLRRTRARGQRRDSGGETASATARSAQNACRCWNI